MHGPLDRPEPDHSVELGLGSIEAAPGRERERVRGIALLGKIVAEFASLEGQVACIAAHEVLEAALEVIVDLGGKLRSHALEERSIGGLGVDVPRLGSILGRKGDDVLAEEEAEAAVAAQEGIERLLGPDH